MRRITSPTLLAIRDLWPAYLGLCLLSAFVPLLYAVAPLYTLQVSERVLSGRNFVTLMFLTVVCTFLIAMGVVIEHIRTKVLQRLGMAIDERLGKVFFSSLYRQAESPGQAEAALLDLNRVRDTLSGPMISAFFDAVWMPLLLFVLCAIHWAFGLLAIVSAAICGALALLNQRLVKQDSELHTKASGVANGFGAALSRNIEVARSMGMLSVLRERWAGLHSGMLGWRYMASKRAGVVVSVTRAVHMFQYVWVYFVGALLFLDNQISASVLMLVVMITLRALRPIEAFISSWHQIPQFLTALSNLDKIFRHATQNRKPTFPGAITGDLVVDGLAGEAPGSHKPILSDVSFTARSGRALAVVGPSGAGKSCLTRFLVRSWLPSRGTIRIGEYVFGEWDPDQLGRLVGYVPQEVEFLPGTVADNISRFREGDKDALLVEAVELAGVQDLIRDLPDGFNTRLGPGGHVLSGGQRQRLAVARAVFGNPYLIVMDEPNANLDSQGEQALGMTIQQLRASNRIVILVTHRASLLPFCDDVLVLSGGKVQNFGERDAVLNRLPRAKPAQTLALVDGAPPPR